MRPIIKFLMARWLITWQPNNLAAEFRRLRKRPLQPDESACHQISLEELDPLLFAPRSLNLHHPLARFGGEDEDLAVAHAAGAGDFDDLADDLFDAGVVDPEIDLDLG